MYKDLDFSRSIEEEHYLEEERYRSPFRRDYSRLIHSPAFRRLQGKTQLFPWSESDFFRNRLTHSLEVAQIAKSLALRINSTILQNKDIPLLDLDLIEFAGLAHDLGHPPFGHQGEFALDKCMYRHGGFEGNAQTFRILSRLEKKYANDLTKSGILEGIDLRVGLNLCSRSLASILKYDRQIPKVRTKFKGPIKGFYFNDKKIIEKIKKDVSNRKDTIKGFKTIECRLMDLADDIAYSTYDMEDSFKAGFLNPYDLAFCQEELIRSITDVYNSRMNKNLKTSDIREQIIKIFEPVFTPPETLNNLEINNSNFKEYHLYTTAGNYKTAKQLCLNGYYRTEFTSGLIGSFIRGTVFELNEKDPAFSNVHFEKEIREKVELMKIITYQFQISSPKLKILEYRGKEIIEKIFSVLSNEKNEGFKLLPNDYQELYIDSKKDDKRRIICDFIAGMTDNYCVEFYGRLTSEDPETIFKPF